MAMNVSFIRKSIISLFNRTCNAIFLSDDICGSSLNICTDVIDTTKPGYTQ